MKRQITKDVWRGRDNTFGLRLDEEDLSGNRTPVDLSAVTSVLLETTNFSLTVDRDDVDAAVNWWDIKLSTGQIEFSLGAWAESNSIPAGEHVCRLTLFDPSNPNGVVWISFDNRELTLDINEV